MSFGQIEIFPDLAALTEAIAEAFVRSAREAMESRGFFNVVLTGGNTVKGLYRLLASPSYQKRIAWKNVRFFWGDERLVPPNHPESNFGLAYRLMLRNVGTRKGNAFRMCGELDPDDAIEDYKRKLEMNASPGQAWPHFDLVLLSLGSDGHIASIFPGEITAEERSSPVIATRSNYQGRPSDRLSLTPIVFNSARRVLFLVSGQSKSVILARILPGGGSPEDLPSFRIHPEDGEIAWFIDESAAGLLPKGFDSHQKDVGGSIIG